MIYVKHILALLTIKYQLLKLHGVLHGHLRHYSLNILTSITFQIVDTQQYP